uniref:15-hydroxyprostaglandin dehydrogenase [NAD(+)] n=1 Tax=Caligus clemensi TaxID=344056 RepID=C1C2P3_CALCM|nr:15-hydroxyprostaglandin dehydrogenase [Caligus clemensi]
MIEFKDKVFLVTGSARGLGKGFSREILRQGGYVMLSDVLLQEGHDTLIELQNDFGEDNVGYCFADVTDLNSFQNLWFIAEKKFNRPVDVLVNNAGVTHQVGWRKCLDVNLKGVMNGTNLAIEKMSTENGGLGGHVVNIGSTGGFVTAPDKESASYFVSKAGVVTLTRSLGSKSFLKESNIRFLCLCPSYADTNFLDTSIRKYIQEQSKLQILTVAAVVQGFTKLFQTGESGRVSILVKEQLPLMDWPNYEENVLLPILLGARLLNKFGYKGIVGSKEQLAFCFALFMLVYMMLRFVILYMIF